MTLAKSFLQVRTKYLRFIIICFKGGGFETFIYITCIVCNLVNFGHFYIATQISLPYKLTKQSRIVFSSKKANQPKGNVQWMVCDGLSAIFSPADKTKRTEDYRGRTFGKVDGVFAELNP